MDEHILNPWNDISYLQHGSPRHRRAYHTLQELEVFQVMAEFTPLLAGTFPLDLNTEQSDLDVLCAASELEAFSQRFTSAYGEQAEACLKQVLKQGVPTVIAGFRRNGLCVEFFAQPQPVTHQRAYRHMLVEQRLLQIGGEAAWKAIRDLKLAGVKTEPAFCQVFHLQGEPYETLLALETLGLATLRQLVNECRGS
ncbi:MAG: DUF4269 domain-containing protein [Anaerolineales bacterium]|nr:DUF4269 domain-containing protein [Anaerolineales bacterium]